MDGYDNNILCIEYISHDAKLNNSSRVFIVNKSTTRVIKHGYKVSC